MLAANAIPKRTAGVDGAFEHITLTGNTVQLADGMGERLPWLVNGIPIIRPGFARTKVVTVDEPQYATTMSATDSLHLAKLRPQLTAIETCRTRGRGIIDAPTVVCFLDLAVEDTCCTPTSEAWKNAPPLETTACLVKKLVINIRYDNHPNTHRAQFTIPKLAPAHAGKQYDLVVMCTPLPLRSYAGVRTMAAPPTIVRTLAQELARCLQSGCVRSVTIVGCRSWPTNWTNRYGASDSVDDGSSATATFVGNAITEVAEEDMALPTGHVQRAVRFVSFNKYCREVGNRQAALEMEW